MTSKTCSYGCATTNSCGKCTGCKGNPDCDVAAKSCTYGCASTNSCGVCVSCKSDPACSVTSLSCTYGCKTTNSCGKCTACYPDNCRNRTAASCSYGCQSYFSDCSSKCQTCKTCTYSTECPGYLLTSCVYGIKDSCTACGVTKYKCDVGPVKPQPFICNSPSRVMNCNGMKCCCPQGVSCTTNYKCFCDASTVREAI